MSHPEMADLKEKLDLLVAASDNLLQALRCELADIVESFGHHFDEDDADIRRDAILEDTTELPSPLKMINAVKELTSDIKGLFEERSKRSMNPSPTDSILSLENANKVSKYLPEEGVTNVVLSHSFFSRD